MPDKSIHRIWYPRRPCPALGSVAPVCARCGERPSETTISRSFPAIPPILPLVSGGSAAQLRARIDAAEIGREVLLISAVLWQLHRAVSPALRVQGVRGAVPIRASSAQRLLPCLWECLRAMSSSGSFLQRVALTTLKQRPILAQIALAPDAGPNGSAGFLFRLESVQASQVRYHREGDESWHQAARCTQSQPHRSRHALHPTGIFAHRTRCEPAARRVNAIVRQAGAGGGL